MARMDRTFGSHAWLARLARMARSLARMARWLVYWQLSSKTTAKPKVFRRDH